MAKWGEGDPRWIVEERADGTNADNWHWTEKNATKWSHNTLTELLVGVAVEDSNGKARISEVDNISGDVVANMRKGKLIFFYEVDIKLKWKGETKDGTKVNGTIRCPNLSEENDADDLEFDTRISSEDNNEKRKVKDLMRKAGAEKLRSQLGKWIVMLKEEYSRDLVKPTKTGGGGDQKTKVTPTVIKENKTVKASPSSSSGADKTTTAKGGYVSITLTEEFQCKPADLFSAICTQEKVRAYTQSECKIDPKVGGEFSLFGGNVTGVFQELEPHKKIKQAWRFKHWPAGHFSTVELTIAEKKDKCELQLKQSNIPKADAESTKSGWRSHQWNRMKQILGFGSPMNFSF